MNASTTTNNNAAANATNTHHSGTTATASTSTGETKSSASSPTTPTSSTTKSAVAKVSARFPQTTSFKTSTEPTALPSQAVVHPVPSLRSSSGRLKWQWTPVQVEISNEIWIFLHPVDKNHQVCVCASPSTEMPSLLVQPELISLEYKKQHGIPRRRGHLEQYWIRIYSYLQPSFPQRIGMRCLCRLFDAVERLTTENSRRSTLMLMPIPSGMWTTFLNVKHDTLEGLIKWVNGVVKVSPASAPQLLFLQEGALALNGRRRDYMYQSLSGACVVVDETGCFRLTGNSITDDDVVRVARKYSNVQSLNLRGCGRITDASLLEVARRCSNLQSLNLSSCKNITDTSLSQIASGCSNLQSLDLSECERLSNELEGEGNINDAVLVAIAHHCPHLRSLNLTHCFSITDAGLTEVARRCRQLQSLNICSADYYCPTGKVTDVGVMEVARGCSHIQSLSLGGNHITDIGVVEVARRCPQLQSLCLASYSGNCIGDASLVELARSCPHLRSLELGSAEGNHNVTDAGVLELARECSQLELLGLMTCSNITTVCRESLRETYPQLKVQ